MTSTPPSIEDRVYTYTVQATDPDADPLTFALSQAPAGMTLDLSTGHLTWEPTLAQQGRHQVEIQVSDGRGGVDSQAFALTVRAELLTSATIGLYQGFDVESGQAVCDPQALVLTRGTMTETTEILLPAIPAGFDFPGAPHCYFTYERSSGGNLLLVLEPGVTAVLLNVPYEDVDQSDIVGLTPWTAGKPVVSSQTAIVKTAGGKYVKIGNIRDHPATWTVSFDYEELVVPQP